MPATIANRPAGSGGHQAASRLPTAIDLSAALFGALAAGLTAQLLRHNALAGGRVARSVLPHHDRGWTHVLANAISVAGGTLVAPTVLLIVAGVLAARARCWTALRNTSIAMVVTGLLIATGKWWAGSLALSGPATMLVVVCGVGHWLLRGKFDLPVRRALGRLAASVVLAVGVAQLYLGHSLWALMLSWLLGAATLGLLGAAAVFFAGERGHH